MEDVKQELNAVKQDIHSIKNDVKFDMGLIRENLTTLNSRVQLVYNAITGNDLTKDGGMVQDIRELRELCRRQGERIETLEKKEVAKSLYVKILWLALGAIVTLILKHYLAP
jgi:hypothetical protein